MSVVIHFVRVASIEAVRVTFSVVVALFDRKGDHFSKGK
jgi:hypothetical protein